MANFQFVAYQPPISPTRSLHNSNAALVQDAPRRTFAQVVTSPTRAPTSTTLSQADGTTGSPVASFVNPGPKNTNFTIDALPSRKDTGGIQPANTGVSTIPDSAIDPALLNEGPTPLVPSSCRANVSNVFLKLILLKLIDLTLIVAFTISIPCWPCHGQLSHSRRAEPHKINHTTLSWPRTSQRCTKRAAAPHLSHQHEKNEHIKTGVNKIIEMKNSMIEELAEQESLKKTKIQSLMDTKIQSLMDTKIQSLMDTKIHYKKQQKMSLHNAITHFKALKVNGDKGEGGKVKIQELLLLIGEDDSLQDMSPEKKKQVLDALRDFCQERGESVCINNRAAAKDMMHCGQMIEDILMGLQIRTGAHGFCLIVPGHVNDLALPVQAFTYGTEDFFTDSLNLVVSEVVALFHQWACVQHKGLEEHNNHRNVCKKITKYMNRGMLNVLGINGRHVSMNYINYKTAIMRDLKIHIVGWPDDIKFKNPSQITCITNLRKLCDAWKWGDAQWEKMMKADVIKLEADLEARKKSTRMEKAKPRAKRSDAGKKRS